MTHAFLHAWVRPYCMVAHRHKCGSLKTPVHVRESVLTDVFYLYDVARCCVRYLYMCEVCECVFLKVAQTSLHDINQSLHIQWPYSLSRSHISPMKSVLWVISSKGKGEFCTQSELYLDFFWWKAFISSCHIEEPSDYLATSTACLLFSETSPPFRMSLAKW